MHFHVTTDHPGPLAVHELLERHANGIWVPDHLDGAQATAFVLDHFRRQIKAELKI